MIVKLHGPIRLSVICPSLICREGMTTILQDLCKQADGKPVEVIALADNGQMTIGEKLNSLYLMAGGEYAAAVGDDDNVAEDYVDRLLEALDGEADLVTFDVDWGKLRGASPGSGHRPLSAVRTELARQFEWPHWWQSEDRVYRKWLQAQGPKTKHIDAVLYRYSWRRHKEEFGGGTYRREGTFATPHQIQKVLRANGVA